MNIEQFIETNIDLVDQNNFTELYRRCVSNDRGKLTTVLYECDINPLLYVREVPEWFAYMSDLISIVIPNRVTSIGSRAFWLCRNLKNITIPNTVTSIGEMAFDSCESLTSIIIPNSVSSISSNAFSFCSNLTNITMPSSVKSIGGVAFAYCTSIMSVTIPNSVTSIGEGAFFGCSSLTNITIPNSVTSIAEGAFKDCSHIQITFSGTKQEWKNLVTGKKIFPDTTYVCNCVDGVVKKSR